MNQVNPYLIENGRMFFLLTFSVALEREKSFSVLVLIAIKLL